MDDGCVHLVNLVTKASGLEPMRREPTGPQGTPDLADLAGCLASATGESPSTSRAAGDMSR